jgi:protein phosphatase
LKIFGNYFTSSSERLNFTAISEKVLKNAIASANLLIYNKARKDETLSGMGTTIVACVVLDNTAVFAHVGDSRLYLVNKELKQLTKDHSVVQTLIETGEITPDDAKRHPRKNVITRALGVEAEVIADFSELQLADNDTLLLCTDGLTNYVTEDIILETFNQNSITSVGDKLIELANLNGGGDNITVVTLTV